MLTSGSSTCATSLLSTRPLQRTTTPQACGVANGSWDRLVMDVTTNGRFGILEDDVLPGGAKGGAKGDSNPWPLACHQQAARPPQYVCAGHRPRKCAPVPSSPHRLRYFPAVPASLPGQAPNKRLTSQNLQELYPCALQGDQHPIAPDECRKAPEAVLGSGHDHCLSPTAASPRSELPATAEPLGRQSPAGHG